MNSNDYEFEDESFEDDGRQPLEEHELHCQEVQRKADALLNIPAAQILGRKFALDLANLVQTHADFNGPFTLSDVLTGSIPEKVIIRPLWHCRSYLHMPLSHAGFIATRNVLDSACTEFEAILAADSAP